MSKDEYQLPQTRPEKIKFLKALMRGETTLDELKDYGAVRFILNLDPTDEERREAIENPGESFTLNLGLDTSNGYPSPGVNRAQYSEAIANPDEMIGEEPVRPTVSRDFGTTIW